MRQIGRCKGCGAAIEWALLNGKIHPFDVAPTDHGRGYELIESERVSEPRAVAVYMNASEVQARTLAGTPVRLVVSHFATCPQAAQFKRVRA